MTEGVWAEGVGWPVLALTAVLGAMLGSFLNVCIHRWPLDQSVVRPRSRCPGCERPIAWYDNVPIVSWLLLRGRCRGCGERISIRYPLVELGAALIWVYAVARFGPGVEALRSALFMTLLLGIGLTDARHYIIPDEFSLGGLGIGLALAGWPGGFPLARAALGAALGFALLWAVAWLGERIFQKPAMGGGDLKMMAMIGAFLGPIGVLLTIFLGALSGTLIFGPISLRTQKLVPFGIFLAIGAFVTHVWGDLLVDWYVTRVLGL
ncbi:MAG: prepilin peptidase [Longimicrobiales bacterium]